MVELGFFIISGGVCELRRGSYWMVRGRIRNISIPWIMTLCLCLRRLRTRRHEGSFVRDAVEALVYCEMTYTMICL